MELLKRFVVRVVLGAVIGGVVGYLLAPELFTGGGGVGGLIGALSVFSRGRNRSSDSDPGYYPVEADASDDGGDSGGDD